MSDKWKPGDLCETIDVDPEILKYCTIHYLPIPPPLTKEDWDAIREAIKEVKRIQNAKS